MTNKQLKMEPYNFMDDHELINHKNLRRAVSDVSTGGVENFGKDTDGTLTKIDEVVRQAECECCGLKEDCTLDYIENVMKSYAGKWVCGLCSDAVKEKLTQSPDYEAAIEEAVSIQRDFCQSFNRTTRLNPKLSLTWSMKKIARRSFENRNYMSSSSSTKSNNIARSSSCIPRIDLINMHG